MITIFEKTYDYESLCDLTRDLEEATDGSSNPKLETLPRYIKNRDVIAGSFKVTIEWNPV